MKKNASWYTVTASIISYPGTVVTFDFFGDLTYSVDRCLALEVARNKLHTTEDCLLIFNEQY